MSVAQTALYSVPNRGKRCVIPDTISDHLRRWLKMGKIEQSFSVIMVRKQRRWAGIGGDRRPPGPEMPAPARGKAGLALDRGPPIRNSPGQAADAHPTFRESARGFRGRMPDFSSPRHAALRCLYVVTTRKTLLSAYAPAFRSVVLNR